MNNEIKKTTNKGASNTPLIIIGLVLVAALIGGWWLYNSSSSKPAVKSNTNSPIAKATPDNSYQTAPAGATPPNMLGSPTATVTVEEFADYQCPTCAVQHPKMKEITGLYGNRIKFIFRGFPLTQIHKNAYEAAVAAEAAGLQGKFWAMQDQLFGNQQTWANSTEARKIFEEYAQKIGLDLARFQSDVAGLPAKTRVDKDLERAKGAGINGTPTIYINGNKLIPEQTEVSAMRQLIDAELQKTSGQTAPNAPTNQAVVVNSSNVNNTNTTTNKK